MVPKNLLKRSTYSIADFYYALHLIHLHKHLGRYKLAKLLQISRAQTRSILEKLVEKELIVTPSQRLGHQLSSQGKEIWEKCQQFFIISSKRIHLGQNYTIGKKDAVVFIEGTGIETLNTVFLRDEALLNGALGCTVFLKEQSTNFYLLDAVYPPLPQKAFLDRKVKRKLSVLVSGIPWTRIIIIVGTADHIITAQIGAISAALLLVPEEIKQYFQGLF
ncbi:MAG: hypothetical protein ACXAC8_10105 [Candidatus Hodarchaeales archaeon]|jgi:hypothetical protein